MSLGGPLSDKGTDYGAKGIQLAYHLKLRGICGLDFAGLTKEMRQDLTDKLRMVHTRAEGQRQFIMAFGLHIAEEIDGDGFKAYWVGSLREIADKGDLSKGQALEKVTATDLFYLRSMDEGMAVGYRRGPLEIDCGGTSTTLAVAPVVRTMPQRMARLEEEVHGIQESLDEQREVMDMMAREFSRFTVWADKGISQLLNATGATYTRYSETHVPY
ncbi:hypothetical protein Tco_0019261 [Tanacetum coccineum]